jgi:hypothetical protein
MYRINGTFWSSASSSVDAARRRLIITGDRDTMVSGQINARALAATLPFAKLVLLKEIRHMPPRWQGCWQGVARDFAAWPEAHPGLTG